MRRLLFMLLAAAVLLGGVLFLTVHDRLTVSPSTIVPENAVAAIEWRAAATSLHSALQSELGRYVMGPDFAGVLQGVEVDPQMVQRFRRLRKLVFRLSSDPGFNWLFSGEATLALLKPDTCPSPTCNLLLVARPKPSLFAERKLATLLDFNRSVRRILYQGRPIYSVPLIEGMEIHVSRCRGMVIMGLCEASVKNSIDMALTRYLGKRTGLDSTEVMATLRQQGGRRVEQVIMVTLPEVLHQLGIAQPEGLAGRLQTLAVVREPIDQGSRLALVGLLDPAHSRSTNGGLPMAQPVVHTRLPGLPEDVLLYVWSNWLSLERFWQAAATSKHQELAAGAFIAGLRIEEYTGLSLAEFLELFGDDFGLMVDQVLTNGFFPVPRVCLLLRIRDRAGLHALLDRLLASLPVVRQETEGSSIYALQMADGLMQPTFALSDEYLLIADSREQVDALLDTDGATLGATPLYQAVAQDLNQPCQLAGYARPAEFVPGLEELARWGTSLLNSRSDAQVPKNTLFLEKIVLPTLRAVSVIGAQSVLGRMDEKMLLLQINIVS
jgi:hypothetical protein